MKYYSFTLFLFVAGLTLSSLTFSMETDRSVKKMKTEQEENSDAVQKLLQAIHEKDLELFKELISKDSSVLHNDAVIQQLLIGNNLTEFVNHLADDAVILPQRKVDEISSIPSLQELCYNLFYLQPKLYMEHRPKDQNGSNLLSSEILSKNIINKNTGFTSLKTYLSSYVDDVRQRFIPEIANILARVKYHYIAEHFTKYNNKKSIAPLSQIGSFKDMPFGSGLAQKTFFIAPKKFDSISERFPDIQTNGMNPQANETWQKLQLKICHKLVSPQPE